MKFCPDCGSELKNKVNFCPDCGSSISNIAERPSSSVNVLERKNKNYLKLLKILFPIILILILLFVYFTYFFKSNKINVRVVLTETSEVTFEADCQPVQSTDSNAPYGIYIDLTGDEVEDFVLLNGNWSRSNSDQCTLSAQFEKPKDLSGYSIKFIADRQDILLANNVPFQENQELLEVFGQVGRIQKINGNLTIYDNISAARFRQCYFAHITGGSKDCGKISVEGLFSCSSATGDISSGKTIKILSENDRELALARFESDGDLSNTTLSDGSKNVECNFPFTAQVPEVKGSYRFLIGNRGEINYSYEQLEERRGTGSFWRVDLKID